MISVSWTCLIMDENNLVSEEVGFKRLTFTSLSTLSRVHCNWTDKNYRNNLDLLYGSYKVQLRLLRFKLDPSYRRGACGMNGARWLSPYRPKKSKGTNHSDHCKSVLLLLRCLQVGLEYFMWMVMKSSLMTSQKESNAIVPVRYTSIV